MLAPLLWLLAGCGLGTQTLVSSGSSGSTTSNVPATVSNLSVEHPRTPEACRVRFTLTDPNPGPARVSFFFVTDDGTFPMEQLEGVEGNSANFSLSEQVTVIELRWPFDQEAGLDSSLVTDVSVRASVQGSNATTTQVGIGNAAPKIDSILVEPIENTEVSGIVLFELLVSDTSGDMIAIDVEYEELDDPGWRCAKPALGSCASGPGVQGLVASDESIAFSFLWDAPADLATEPERSVRLRFTPTDGVAYGDPKETHAFIVDNNAEPLVDIEEGLLLLNTDQRRGIPIPFRTIDPEGDAVRFVLQWRRPQEDFPALPTNPAAIDSILADPVERKRLHIASELERFVEGHPVTIDATTIRLPELAGSAAHLTAVGLVGRELDILRASRWPEPVAWRTRSVVAPIAALPWSDGLTALVLDAPEADAWRLTEVVLATGASVREIVSSAPGRASAMCLEPGGGFVLVASDEGGSWRVDRVNVETGTIETRITAGGTTELGSVRGIASLGTDLVLITVDESLLKLAFADTAPPTASIVRTGLQTPWGLAVDRWQPRQVFVSERDASSGTGRLLKIDIDTSETVEIVAPGLLRPRSIALDTSGKQLFAVCDVAPSSGRVELRALRLGTAEVATAGSVLTRDARALAVGSDGLLLLVRSVHDDLLVGGGVEQRRTIIGYTTATHEVIVDEAFDPTPEPWSRWRVRNKLRAKGSPTGSSACFVWDSTELRQAGKVHLRATVIDTDIGIGDETVATKTLLSPWEGGMTTHGGLIDGPRDVAVADIDLDGDLDVVTANFDGDNLTILFTGADAPQPVTLGVGVLIQPWSVAVADLNQDSLPDIVSANRQPGNLTVFFQLPGGGFSRPSTLTPDAASYIVRGVDAADIDGDGDTDLVAAVWNSSELVVFLQGPEGFDLGFRLSVRGTENWRPVDVLATDVDGDGHIDLVSANERDDSIAIFFQDPSGGFVPEPVRLGDPACPTDCTMDHPQAVVAGDLDGDGDLDLVSANQLSTNVTAFLQTAPRQFARSPSFALGGPDTTPSPSAITIADLDRDGAPEIIVASASAEAVAVFFQIGPGEYDPEPLLLKGLPARGCGAFDKCRSSIVVADLDADGDPDIITTDPDNDSLVIHAHVGPEKFDDTPTVLGSDTATSAERTRGICAADLDGDGDLDLAATDWERKRVAIFLQLGPGVFETVSSGPQGVVLVNPEAIAAGDLDGDGDVDLVLTNTGNEDSLTLLEQVEDGTFVARRSTLGDVDLDQPRAVLAADLDGDGLLDVTSANYFSDNLTAFFQDAPWSFGTRILPPGEENLARGACGLTSTDIDGDGDQDLVSANSDDDSLTIFYQTRRRAFDETRVLPGSSTQGTHFVIAVDIDGDGDPDVLSTNELSDELRIFRQREDGTFAPTEILGDAAFTARPESIAPGDIDGDGDLDLVTANHDGESLAVFHQTLPGVFTSEPLVITDDLLQSPTFAIQVDLDGDGDLDLVCRSAGGDRLLVFWGGR